MTPEWTEGICGDGAVILRDGQMVTISELLEILNNAEAARLQAFEEAAKIAEEKADGLEGMLKSIADTAYGVRATDCRDVAAAIRQHAKGEGK